MQQLCNDGGMNYDEVEEALKKYLTKAKSGYLFTAGDRITTTTMQALQN